METQTSTFCTKQIYYCETCDYRTSNKSNFNKHISTRKHKMETGGNPKSTKQNLAKKDPKKSEKNDEKNEKKTSFFCSYCNKEYHSKSGYWKHRKRCQKINNNENNEVDGNEVLDGEDTQIDNNSIKYKDEVDYKEICIQMIKQNNELQKTIQDLIPKIGNNTTVNNTTNKINMNIFLNEYCKDALNLVDFVNSIQLQLDDLEHTKTYGYVEGISNIFIRALKDLDVSKRPIHCTDLKREVLYVKDNNIWQKENEENPKLVKAIDNVTHNNFCQIKQWEEQNPECRISTHKKNDEYLQIVSNCMGGIGDNETKNAKKIIKNVAKNVYLDSNNKKLIG